MVSAELREEQATTCLEAASTRRLLLLRVATHLTGNAEEGMDLFQQTLLNCHDAIRRMPNGFTGDRYEFYLLWALKNLPVKRQKQRRHEPLVEEMEPAEAEPAGLELSALAEEVMQAVRERFTPADRAALRLHIDGHSCQEIAEMIGKKGQSWFGRRSLRLLVEGVQVAAQLLDD